MNTLENIHELQEACEILFEIVPATRWNKIMSDGRRQKLK